MSPIDTRRRPPSGHSRPDDLGLLTQVVEALPAGIVAIDGDGNVILGNDFIRELTLSVDDAGIGGLLFLHGDGRPYDEAERPVLLALRTGRRVVGRELDVLDRDGRCRYLLANAVPVLDEDGAVRLVVGAYFDITLQKEAELRADRHLRRQESLLHTLRSSLLPPHLPEIPGAQIAARYHAATDEIGGDFYDVFPLRGQSFGLVLGDVCGQGSEAAVVTSLIRYTLRGAAMSTPRPAEALALVNEALLVAGGDRFCTAVFARVRSVQGELHVHLARAGHPFPLIRRNDGTVTPVRRGGALLGVVEDLSMDEERIVLEEGETLVLVTDGVTEALTAGGEELGWEGVADLLERLPAGGSPDEVADALLGLTEGHGAGDDVAVVVLRAGRQDRRRRRGDAHVVDAAAT